MHTKAILLVALLQAVFAGAPSSAQAKPVQAGYPVMAPLSQYLMPEGEEIALARSAAPKSISEAAEVMVLRRDGYATAVKGTNGFLCIVQRSWANPTDNAEFWNPKLRSPNCFNEAAAKSLAQIYLMKTRLVLAGKSRAEILAATNAALDSGKLPPLLPGTMVYMMSKQQYLNDAAKAWHPHLMFYVAGDVGSSWGANMAGSPVIAVNDPEERVTIFMVVVGHWSDGTAYQR